MTIFSSLATNVGFARGFAPSMRARVACALRRLSCIVPQSTHPNSSSFSLHSASSATVFSSSCDSFGVSSSASSGGLYRLARAYSSASATSIKALRERTGAPIKDVKAALLQCEWDLESAFVELRKKGLTAASRKVDRVAADGLLAVAEAPGVAAVVEINSETDFVARNEIFQHLAERVARAAIDVEAEKITPGSADAIKLSSLEAVKIKLEHSKLSGEATVQEAVAEVAAMMGENVRLRRGFLLSSPSGIVSSYLHASVHPGLARVIGLVALEPEHGNSEAQQEKDAEVGAALAMHVVAAKPLFLSRQFVPERFLKRELDILRSQAQATGKPANVIEKMIQGRLRKYFEEVVLPEQKFVVNDSMTVQAVLDQHLKQSGRRLNISSFLRMEVGEGIQKREA